MPDDMDLLARKRTLDLMTKLSRPALHAGDRRNARHHHSVSRSSKEVRETAKIGGQGNSAESDVTEAK